jgi:hypothetical protein
VKEAYQKFLDYFFKEAQKEDVVETPETYDSGREREGCRGLRKV